MSLAIMITRSLHRISRLVRRTRICPWVIAACLLVLALAGCGGAEPLTPPAARPSTPTQPPQPTQAPTPASPTDAGPINLVWWTPEFLSPEAPQPAGSLLTEQLSAFSAAQDGKVQVEAVRKARYGKGGLLDTLRTAAPVAKGSLPDIIALDAAEVEKAAEAGLLQPLDGLLDPSVIEKLYPFASEAGRFGERLYAVQYLADVEHGAYLPAQVAEAPATWADVIAQRITYLFPVAQPPAGQGPTVGPAEILPHAVLSQYLSAGGTLTPDRRLVLEAGPLLRLLTFYADASKAGVLPGAGQVLDGEAVWNTFAQGLAPLAYVGARRFNGRGDLPAEHTDAPGYESGAPNLASGWTLAITATDPRRQQAAAELIAWLLRPENAGVWAAKAGWLPTSSDALEALGDGPYYDFLDSQLAQARSLPAGPDYAATAARMQAAIQAVLQGEAGPAAATEAATKGP